ncbi:MAG TPA: SMC-Scp complex subunit ScpB [Steroidobacteraceae bacterium]|nr:SMC-Scp complex subunit ScpB [Steroidobacteraceae bacterium]
MTDSYLKNVIEAALLAAARPVSVSELQQIFDEHARPSPKEMRELLEQLTADYEGRGVTIRETANGFRFQVRTEFAHEVSRLWPDRPKKYSRALLETLALIAYRQPITRAEIENVRGVAVNPEIVKTLMERNWVRVVGHRDVPGHPELLGTTSEFLDYFSLKSIEDLPPLAELKSLSDLNLQLPLPGTTPENAGVPEGQGDSGEVALVPVGDGAADADRDAASGDPVSEADRLDAAADDDADDEELSAPGNAGAGLVAAPPSDEN